MNTHAIPIRILSSKLFPFEISLFSLVCCARKHSYLSSSGAVTIQRVLPLITPLKTELFLPPFGGRVTCLSESRSNLSWNALFDYGRDICLKDSIKFAFFPTCKWPLSHNKVSRSGPAECHSDFSRTKLASQTGLWLEKDSCRVSAR